MLNKEVDGVLLFRDPLKLLENEQTFRKIHAGVTGPDTSCPQLTPAGRS